MGIGDTLLLVARKNAVPIFLLTGTLGVVVTKVVYSCEAPGLHGHVHAFAKPWFNGWVMFLGMTLCLLTYQLERAWSRSVGREVQPTSPKLYWAIALPALCDMVSTFLINVGLLWISGSVWQMLRGSVIVFTAALKVLYRRKRLYSSELFGMLAVVVGIVIVGVSAFKTPGEATPAKHVSSSDDGDLSSSEDRSYSSSSSSSNGTTHMIVGIVLVIFSQMLAAVQTIVEEKLLHDVQASPMLVVGMEGVWGLLLCSFISMPIAQFLTGPEGDGLHEDTLDSFVMVWNSPMILWLNLAFAFFILFFNLYGMIITEATDALTRNLLEPMRTLFVWVAMVFIYYVVSHNYGESVNWWSFLQLGGFLVLVLGFLVYNGALHLPCLGYKSDKKASKAASVEEARPQQDEKAPLLVNVLENADSHVQGAH
eukprot:m51a1_g2571 hypothetical protein (424) ;mRNA; r:377534-378949